MAPSAKLWLTFAAAMLLASCGGSTAPAPGASAGSAGAATAAKPAGSAAPETAAQPSTGSAAWDDVLAAAKREGRVVVSGQAAPGADEGFVAAFKRQYPDVEVEYLGMTSSEAATKHMTERQAGRFTVDLFIHGTPDILSTFMPAGAVDPIQPFLTGPDIQDQSKWLGGKLNFADDAGRYDLIFTGGVKVPLFFNPKSVSASQFTSYKDLLDPKWKGKIAMFDPRVAGSGNGMVTFWYRTPSLGKDFIKQLLTQQNVAFTKDDRQLADWVARGEYPLGVGASDFTGFDLKSKGVPIEPLAPDALKETSYLTAGFGSVAVMNRAPHPNATRVYLNWLLSKETQGNLTKVTAFPSRRLDASTAGLPDLVVAKQGLHYQDSASEATAKVKTEVLDFLKTVLPS